MGVADVVLTNGKVVKILKRTFGMRKQYIKGKIKSRFLLREEISNLYNRMRSAEAIFISKAINVKFGIVLMGYYS